MAMLSELVPDVQLEVSQCPVMMIQRKLNEALRDFCWHTHYWQHSMDALTLMAYLASAASTYIYTLPVPTGTELLEVHELIYKGLPLLSKSVHWLDSNLSDWRGSTGDPNYFLTLSNNQVRFIPASIDMKPSAITGLLALQPVRKSLFFPDELREYDQTIVFGALSSLKYMTGKPWYDEKKANLYQLRFREGISRAKMQVIKSFSSGPETIRRSSWL